MLSVLGLAPDEIPLITSADVERAKPDPELLVEAVERLGAEPTETLVFGDSTWYMLAAKRASCFGVGVMSGGFGRSELLDARAFRVYADIGDVLRHLDELGLKRVGASL
jgi:beta-phosphoglucomutase-like phosphatase (HAD superfamily)